MAEVIDLTRVGDGDGDDYVRVGASEAEFHANAGYESSRVRREYVAREVGHIVQRGDAFRRQAILIPTGRLVLRKPERPSLN